MKIHWFRRKRISRILIPAVFTVLGLSAALALWTASAEALAHCAPECAQVDLTPVLEKEVLTEADYALLFRQTGLARAGVEELRASGRQWELLGLQQRFFAGAEVECSHSGLFVQSERLTNFRSIVYAVDFLPTVQDGDILITFNGHVFGWRSGHAAIVVDAEKRLTLEAIMPGYESMICSLDSWQEYPGFALLRLRGVSARERARIAAYARECLTGLPYSLAAFTDGGDMPLSATQCAHLVWYTYQHFGYDLDSNGGFVVTPSDLYRSDLLEVVQIYGLSPNY